MLRAAGAGPARTRGRAVRRASGARLCCGISNGSDALGSRSSPDVPVPSTSLGAARAGPRSPAPRACSAPARGAAAGRRARRPHAAARRDGASAGRLAPRRHAVCQCVGRKSSRRTLMPSVVCWLLLQVLTSYLPQATRAAGAGMWHPIRDFGSCRGCARGRTSERGVAGSIGGALDALRHRRLLPGLQTATLVNCCPQLQTAAGVCRLTSACWPSPVRRAWPWGFAQPAVSRAETCTQVRGGRHVFCTNCYLNALEWCTVLPDWRGSVIQYCLFRAM